MSAPRRRLAVVLSHPTQYYSPWFRWMAQRGAPRLRVFYLWDFGLRARRDPQFGVSVRWDVDLTSGYEWELVPNRARDPGTHHFAGLRNPGLTARLAAWSPEAVLLFGYPWASHLRALAWARLHRVPLIFRGDSHFLGRAEPGWSRTLPLRLLYRQFAAVTYVGAANRRYFERLGVPRSRLFFAPHAVDAARFDPARPEYRAQAEALRRTLDLPPGCRVILFAGKWVPAKQPVELLAAFLALAPANAALVFVGDGPERPRLEALAAGAPRAPVRFLPFANQSEMPSRYALADLFVLPSRGCYETWGLAVNEAMHMGVPCLVSDRVGCAEDLVAAGATGWVFAAERPGALGAALGAALAALSEPGQPARLAAAARARAAGYTYEQATAGLLQAMDSLPPA
ncbi:MAG TPA: glycosyltransferase family 4 protein [Opitutaceae bacterium]|nr:glycosyltransferase family 4 protein [Opitutaceae bacterium]